MVFAACLELVTEGADELKAVLYSQTLHLKCQIIGIYFCFFVLFMLPGPFCLSRVCCEEPILDIIIHSYI